MLRLPNCLGAALLERERRPEGDLEANGTFGVYKKV